MQISLILDLCAQVAVVIAVGYVMVVRKPSTAKPRPIWPGIAGPVLAVGIISQFTARNHTGETGAREVSELGFVLIGIAIMALLVAIREFRALDQPAAA
jgi:hypothetical protein